MFSKIKSWFGVSTVKVKRCKFGHKMKKKNKHVGTFCGVCAKERSEKRKKK